MKKFLLSFPKSLIIAQRQLEQKPVLAHRRHTSGKFYRHGDWLECHRWPNSGKLLIIKPKTTCGPRVAKQWQNLPTIHCYAAGGMLSGKQHQGYFVIYIQAIN